MLIGDAGVGKSSLLLRFAEDTFTDRYLLTLGINFKFKTLKVDGKVIKTQIWDMAGHERYWKIVSAYYRLADVFIFVYDVTEQTSFDHIEHWLADIDTRASRNVPRLLIGNKGDLSGERVVDYATAKQYADSVNMLFIETSAKCDVNVELAFVMMVSLTKGELENKNKLSSGRPEKIYLDNKPERRKSRCCC